MLILNVRFCIVLDNPSWQQLASALLRYDPYIIMRLEVKDFPVLPLRDFPTIMAAGKGERSGSPISDRE